MTKVYDLPPFDHPSVSVRFELVTSCKGSVKMHISRIEGCIKTLLLFDNLVPFKIPSHQLHHWFCTQPLVLYTTSVCTSEWVTFHGHSSM